MRNVASYGSIAKVDDASAPFSSSSPAASRWGWRRVRPSDALYRNAVLAVACTLTFGLYFCYDTPGALVTDITADLRLTSFRYNLLVSLYSWPNTVMVFVGGLLIDRYGNRKSAVALTLLVLVGQLIMTVAVTLRWYWLLLVGRFVFGIGGESLNVCQSTIVSRWFAGHELAMAFGFSLTVSRIGSILSFNTLPYVHGVVGLSGAFAVGALICTLSIAAASVFVCLDRYAEQCRARESPPSAQASRYRVDSEEEAASSMAMELEDGIRETKTASGDVDPSTATSEPPERPQRGSARTPPPRSPLQLGLSFWLCSLIGMLAYSTVFSFIAVGGDFFHWRYGASREYSGFLVSLVYDISMFMAPLLGRSFDQVGLRGMFLLTSCALSTLSFRTLGTHNAHGNPALFPRIPLLSMLTLGLAFSGVSSSLWPSMTLVVPAASLGTALGVAQALQNFGTSTASIFVGRTVDDFGYDYVMKVFAGVSAVAAVLAVWWNLDDWVHHGGRVNRVLPPEPEDEAELRRQLIAAGLAVDYVPLYVPVYVLVSPQAIDTVRRAYYRRLGEGEVGMRRRDLYARLGIAHPDVQRKAAEAGVRLPRPESLQRPTGISAAMTMTTTPRCSATPPTAPIVSASPARSPGMVVPSATRLSTPMVSASPTPSPGSERSVEGQPPPPPLPRRPPSSSPLQRSWREFPVDRTNRSS